METFVALQKNSGKNSVMSGSIPHARINFPQIQKGFIMKKHIGNYFHHFKQSGCDLVLLGQPVISYATPFVTVAFLEHPNADDYLAFQNSCWDLHAISTTKHLDYRNGVDYIEVTFKRNDHTATKPEKMPHTV